MTSITFEGWPKTPRLFRDAVITEKIDGTNAAVIVTPLSVVLPPEGIFTPHEGKPPGWQYAEKYLTDGTGWNPGTLVDDEGIGFIVAAQSRTRLITPGKTTDNFGFAAWVQENAAELASLLGPGRHFGEWWGKGIQRGYGLEDRRFSLFNVGRYGHVAENTDLVSAVPTLYQGPFNTEQVAYEVADLALMGSSAARGFMAPEGVVVYHAAARQSFKVLIENDELPKGQA